MNYNIWESNLTILTQEHLALCLFAGGNCSWHLTFTIFIFLKLPTSLGFCGIISSWVSSYTGLSLPFQPLSQDTLSFSITQILVFPRLLFLAFHFLSSGWSHHHSFIYYSKCWLLPSKHLPLDPHPSAPSWALDPYSTALRFYPGYFIQGFQIQYIQNQTHYLFHTNSSFIPFSYLG